MMVNMLTRASAPGLSIEFVDASPSPFHVCATVAGRLRGVGYTELAEADRWPRSSAAAGRFFVVRAGSLVAWHSADAGRLFRIVAAHTDSPEPSGQAASRPVGGGLAIELEPHRAWLNWWLDRDPGSAAGCRCATRGRRRCRAPVGAHRRADPAGAAACDPSPRTAAHGETGPAATPQRGVGHRAGTRPFLDYVADPSWDPTVDLLAADLMTIDLCPSALIGADNELNQRSAAR